MLTVGFIFLVSIFIVSNETEFNAKKKKLRDYILIRAIKKMDISTPQKQPENWQNFRQGKGGRITLRLKKGNEKTPTNRR